MVGDDDSLPDVAEYDIVVLEPLVVGLHDGVLHVVSKLPLVVANVEVPVNIHSLSLNISVSMISRRCFLESTL